MISYSPFYKTLKEKQITEYRLLKNGFSGNTLYRMSQGEPITTKTLDQLCQALNCEVYDIIRYVEDTGKTIEGTQQLDLTNDEIALIKKYRNATLKTQKAINAILKI